MPRHHGDRATLHAAAHHGAHPIAVHIRFRPLGGTAARRVRSGRTGAPPAVFPFAFAVVAAGQPEGVAVGAGVAEHRQRTTAGGEYNRPEAI